MNHLSDEFLDRVKRADLTATAGGAVRSRAQRRFNDRDEAYPVRPGYVIEHYAIHGLKPGFRHRYRVHRA